jgi:hypothetical protein
MDTQLSFQSLYRALRATLLAMPPGLFGLCVLAHGACLTIILRFLPFDETISDPEVMQQMLQQWLKDWGLVFLIYQGLAPLLSAMVFHAVRMGWLGVSTNVRLVLRDSVRVWPATLLIYLILEFIYGLSLQYFFGLPAIVLIALLCAVLPRVVLGKRAPWHAFADGFALTKGRRLQLIGLTAVFIAFCFLAFFAVGIVASPLLLADALWLQWVGALLMATSLAAVITLGDVAQGLIYQYLESRHAAPRGTV